MLAIMDSDQADRAARFIGWSSGAIGVTLLAAPGAVNRLLHIEGNRTMQGIGLIDLVLAPGLIASRSRRHWVIARASLNVAIAALLIQRGTAAHTPRPLAAAAALSVATVSDMRTARALMPR
jgi:hypothetical protein